LSLANSNSWPSLNSKSRFIVHGVDPHHPEISRLREVFLPCDRMEIAYLQPVSRKASAAALAIVVILVALAFADVILLGKAFYVRDVARGFYSDFAAIRNVVRAGELPVWNPYYSSGQPLAANPKYAALYPPVWLAIPFDGFRAFALVGVLHYLIAAVGMFLLLRSMSLHPAAAAFGAISFALGAWQSR